MLPGIYEQISFAKRDFSSQILRRVVIYGKQKIPRQKITVTRDAHKINETNTFSGRFMYNIMKIPC